MIKIDGYYYDGKSSIQKAVVITFERSGEVLIHGAAVDIKIAFDQLKIAARLGNTRRSLFMADGAKLETDNNQAVDKVCAYFDRNIFYSLLHSLEKNWIKGLALILPHQS